MCRPRSHGVGLQTLASFARVFLVRLVSGVPRQACPKVGTLISVKVKVKTWTMSAQSRHFDTSHFPAWTPQSEQFNRSREKSGVIVVVAIVIAIVIVVVIVIDLVVVVVAIVIATATGSDLFTAAESSFRRSDIIAFIISSSIAI